MTQNFHCKDKVKTKLRGVIVETFITKVITSEYIDADGETITTRYIYYTDATGGIPAEIIIPFDETEPVKFNPPKILNNNIKKTDLKI